MNTHLDAIASVKLVHGISTAVARTLFGVDNQNSLTDESLNRQEGILQQDQVEAWKDACVKGKSAVGKPCSAFTPGSAVTVIVGLALLKKTISFGAQGVR